jgi:LuxR family maltose regulon positive regulatory protein
VRPKQLDELRTKVDAMRTGVLGASSPTKSELRLVPLLFTHLTYREIGERLYISQNTVKKHAMPVYQKFGVSSRNQAVQRALEIGLGP